MMGSPNSAALLRAAAEYAALVASSHGWLPTSRLAPSAASVLQDACGAILPPAVPSGSGSHDESSAPGTSALRLDPSRTAAFANSHRNTRTLQGYWHEAPQPPAAHDAQASIQPKGKDQDGQAALPSLYHTRNPHPVGHPASLPTASGARQVGATVAGPPSGAAGVAAGVATLPSDPPATPHVTGWRGPCASLEGSLGLRPQRPAADAQWRRQPLPYSSWAMLMLRHAASTPAAAASTGTPDSVPQRSQHPSAAKPSEGGAAEEARQGAGGSSGAATATATAAAEEAAKPLGFIGGRYDVKSFPPERIRNFCIIAHVDHGKSTIADRLMEMTGALGARTTHNAQYLDKLQVERERGITVKAQTVSLVYHHGGVPYLLNLIDTPGHVDFSYEVSRSLAACQGALLVVDAGQGIQAQTVANFYLAFEQGMDLIPVVNKIDLPAADPRGCADQMAAAFDMDPEGVLFTSAKTGQGMEAVLPAVVERIRPPFGSRAGPLRMLLFDAFHDEYRGVVVLVEVVDGEVEVGQRVAMASTGSAFEVQEVGLLAPERHPTGRLLTGQVGYLMCGIKDLKAARVGDTLYAATHGPGAVAGPPPQQLPGFKPAKAMVFAGLFPLGGDGQEFDSLAAAMDKLLLNDASVVVRRENSDALGPGFRCGFLGMLHMEIFTQRLEQEFKASVVTTTPMVPYMLEMTDGRTVTLESASDFPLDKKVLRILEPTVTASIITPDSAVGRIMELCTSRRGEQLEHSALGGGRTLLRYRLPLAELAGDFYSAVKSRSQGYASFDYEEGPYRPADLVRLDILAHGQSVDALARMVAREDAAAVGRALLLKMKDLLDRQQFEVVLQAAANGKIVARETIKALRKNVTAKCYGGDITRKRKLLDRQKAGKRRMKRLGSIDVPQELFPELMRTR